MQEGERLAGQWGAGRMPLVFGIFTSPNWLVRRDQPRSPGAFRLDQSVGLNTPDTNWQTYVGNGSTETVVDTGVAPNPYISSGPPPYGNVTDQSKLRQMAPLAGISILH
jgi:hypothetical protein